MMLASNVFSCLPDWLLQPAPSNFTVIPRVCVPPSLTAQSPYVSSLVQLVGWPCLVLNVSCDGPTLAKCTLMLIRASPFGAAPGSTLAAVSVASLLCGATATVRVVEESPDQ